MLVYYVVFTKSYTGEQVFPPQPYPSKETANSAALLYNLTNQDQTRNCIVANVQKEGG